MVSIKSETGKLEKVIIHSPGPEIQDMTPKMAEQLLYNDIIPLSVVAAEHESFRKVLECSAEVYEFSELLTEALSEKDVREKTVAHICDRFGIQNRGDELAQLPADILSGVIINGIKSRNTSLEKYLKDRPYDLNPLPNLYFTRDSAAVIGTGVITGAMANEVRIPEAIASAAVFSGAGVLKNNGFIFEGHRLAEEGVSIEGGDILVLSEKCLLIGISERTSPRAVDRLVENLSVSDEITVFAVILPLERATIHLDMVLTLLSEDEMMVYKPCFEGAAKLKIVRIKASPGKAPAIIEVPDLIKALKKEGYDMKMIYCAGGDLLQQQREQWLSGNNFFALAPGKVIGYDCNKYTMEALSSAGYEIKTDREYIAEGGKLSNYKKLAVGIMGAELARGGGGPRCMTMPVKRLAL